MSLNQYYRTNTGLSINKWAHYLPLYERYFSAFRDRSILFIEVGTGQGGSSRMWEHYFGPLAQIVTLDVREECKALETDRIKVRVGSQDDEGFLQSVIDEFGAPDVVLDDGSHWMAHVKATFRYLYPRMAREAVYVVEDMHTAYWPFYGGGLRKTGTFIEDMKELIDELQAPNPHHAHMEAGDMPSSEISRMTRGVYFHQSVVAIEKGPFADTAERSIPFVSGQTVW